MIDGPPIASPANVPGKRTDAYARLSIEICRDLVTDLFVTKGNNKWKFNCCFFITTYLRCDKIIDDPYNHQPSPALNLSQNHGTTNSASGVLSLSGDLIPLPQQHWTIVAACKKARLPIPAGILRIPVFSVPVALFFTGINVMKKQQLNFHILLPFVFLFTRALFQNDF
jgi:hypothetical protein